MRLARVSSYYPEYVRGFYAARPELVSASFEAQRAALDRDAFGWADYWTVALSPLGYEVFEIVGNIPSLQSAWARENGVDPTLEPFSLVAEQLAKFDPDVLFISDYSNYSASWVAHVRTKCPSLKLVVGWCGAPYSDGSVFRAYDLVLSNIPELVAHFRQAGHRCEHLNHAFEPRVLDRLGPPKNARDTISFVGQIVKSDGFHLEREKLLAELAKSVPLEVFSSASNVGFWEDAKSMLKGAIHDASRPLRALGLSENVLGSVPYLGKHLARSTRPARARSLGFESRLRPPVFGLEMFRTLRDSVATLNQHIAVSKDSASNMRMFEATGAGGCLVTDWKENIRSLFDPETEIVTYRSVEECAEKSAWLIANPDRAKSIAEAGQRRTLRDHTFSKRAPLLDRYIRDRL